MELSTGYEFNAIVERDDAQSLILRQIAFEDVFGFDQIPLVPVRGNHVDVLPGSVDQLKDEVEYFGADFPHTLDRSSRLKLTERPLSQRRVEPVPHFIYKHHVLKSIKINCMVSSVVAEEEEEEEEEEENEVSVC